MGLISIWHANSLVSPFCPSKYTFSSAGFLLLCRHKRQIFVQLPGKSKVARAAGLVRNSSALASS